MNYFLNYNGEYIIGYIYYIYIQYYILYNLQIMIYCGYN